MKHINSFDSIFEPALLNEINQFGELKSFKEGNIIMDYGKYIRMMPLITKGTVKALRLDKIAIKFYYTIYQATKVVRWPTVVVWKLKKRSKSYCRR